LREVGRAAMKVAKALV